VACERNGNVWVDEILDFTGEGLLDVRHQTHRHSGKTFGLVDSYEELGLLAVGGDIVGQEQVSVDMKTYLETRLWVKWMPTFNDVINGDRLCFVRLFVVLRVNHDKHTSSYLVKMAVH